MARPSRRSRSWLKLGAGIIVVFAAVWWLLPYFVVFPAVLLDRREVSTRYVAKGGQPLRQLLSSDGQRAGDAVAFEQIPRVLIDATLAAEDKRFFSHSGIDWLAVARAMRSNLASKRVVSGASTITQQLVKISEPRKERSLAAKVVEALQARLLERRWSKQEIISAYLNRVSYGNLFTGCSSAASGYFNKPLSDLTPAEAAFLAALPQAPGRMNPFRDSADALKRQKRILQQMASAGMLDARQLEVATHQEIKLQRFAGGFAAPHVVSMLVSQDSPAEVYTTIDFALQRQVEEIIRARLNGLESRHVSHAAVVVIENRSGHVLALAGSRDFFAADGGQINGAWVPHSPGSAVKPFTYQLAFEKGFTPASIIADLPVEYTTGTGTYRPENYDHKIYGPMTCRTALGNSLNISAVKVLQNIGGPQTLLDRLHGLGFTTLDETAEHYGLGLTIGNAPVRLVELANAYASLARLGLHMSWCLVPGEEPKGARVMSQAECWLIADILSDNQARLLTFGTRSPLRLPFRVAVKTGTSSTYRDNWALGFTPEFTVGVWAGNFDNTPMQNVSGVTGAAPIFRDVFIDLQTRFGVTWFAKPDLIVSARIDPRTGKRLTPQSPAARMSREELFVAGTEPPAAEAADYEADTGRAILPPEFSGWSRSRDNWMGDLVVCGGSGPVSRPLRITNPVAGTVIRLDPDIAGNGSRLMLEAEPPAGVKWMSGTLEVRVEGGRAIALLKPGRHQITASRGSETAKTFVIVEQE